METQNFLLMDASYPVLNQGYLEECMERYKGEIRNFYRNSREDPFDGEVTYMMIAAVIASSINYTLITFNHTKYSSGHSNMTWDTESKFPRIFFDQLLTDSEYYGVINVWNAFYLANFSKRENIPNFVWYSPFKYNFVYCSLPKSLVVSIWDFRGFFSPFDRANWIFLFLCSICLTLLLTWFRVTDGLSLALLSSFGILLNVFALPENRKSKIFVLWMLINLLIVNLYTGDMTSNVIKPPPDERIPNVFKLENANYTFVYRNKDVKDWVLGVFEGLVHKGFATDEIKTCAKMLQSAEVPDTEDIYPNYFYEKDQYAMLDYWMYALEAFDIIVTKIQNSGTTKSRKSAKRCYIGEELISTIEVYIGFLPPHSDRLSKMFRRLVSSGVVGRWEQEYAGMVHSRRVQDRGKVKTKIRLDTEGLPKIESLKMRGNTATVFLLWLFCLASSILMFCLEAYIINGLSFRIKALHFLLFDETNWSSFFNKI